MARIGLIGCGDVARFGHVPAIHRTPELELVAHFDPNPRQAASLTEIAPHSKAFSDQSKFFDENLDAVVICSAAGAHKENLFAAAAKGIHVLCEKPLAITDKDAVDMVQEMERVKRQLFTGFVYRFSPVAMQIRDWVRSNAAGNSYFRLFAWRNGSQPPFCLLLSTACVMNSIPSTPS